MSSFSSFKLISSSQNEIKVFRFNSTTLQSNLLKYKNSKSNFGLGITPDNEWVVAAINPIEFCCWKMSCLPPSEKDKRTLARSTSQDSLARSGADAAITADLDPNDFVQVVKLPASIIADHSITCIATGRKSNRYIYVACTSASKKSSFILVWDRRDLKYLKNQINVSDPVCRMAVTTDDLKIAAALVTKDYVNASIALHSLRSNTTTYLQSPFDGPVTCLDFYPFKKSVLVAGSEDGSVATWDANTGKSPTSIKKRIHAGPITAIAFAPCNKHFFCSVGQDKMVYFHDIITPVSGKGILQSYEAEWPLLSLTINDEHTLAMGDSKGNILIYDLRQKQLVHQIETGSNDPVLFLAFQPPKWAISAASKDPVVVDFSKRVISPGQAWTDSDPLKESLQSNKADDPASAPQSVAPKPNATVMDMFSPVNKSKVQKTSAGDLRRAATMGLFQEKLRQVKQAASQEQTSTLTAATPTKPDQSNLIITDLSATKVEEHPIDSTPEPITTAQKKDTTDEIKEEPKEEKDDDNVSVVETQAPISKKPPKMPILTPGHAAIVSTPSNPQSLLNDTSVSAPTLSKDSVMAESIKRVGGMIGGQTPTPLNNLEMTPSVFLKSAYAQKVASDKGKENSDLNEEGSVSTLQYKIIRDIVEDVVQEHHEQLRNDIQNLHLEILRQFQIQKTEMEYLMESLPSKPVYDLLERLQEDNDRLRRNF